MRKNTRKTACLLILAMLLETVFSGFTFASVPEFPAEEVWEETAVSDAEAFFEEGTAEIAETGERTVTDTEEVISDADGEETVPEEEEAESPEQEKGAAEEGTALTETPGTEETLSPVTEEKLLPDSKKEEASAASRIRNKEKKITAVEEILPEIHEALVSPSLLFGAAAGMTEEDETEADGEEIQDFAEEELPEYETEEIDIDEETGYLSFDFFAPEAAEESGHVPVSETAAPQRKNLFLSAGTETEPSSYDGRNLLPAVRNQNNYNTCWAFSAAAAAESSLIRSGRKTKEEADVSELGLAYFLYHSPTNDPLGLLSGKVPGSDGKYINGYDKNQIVNGKNYLSIGGNPLFSSVMLSGWEGVQEEELIPYSAASASLTLPEEYVFTNESVLQEAMFYNLSANPSLVKQAIRENGGVSAEIYSGNRYEYYFDEKGRCCYFSGSTKAADHSVFLCGWDDAFPKESFAEPDATPSEAQKLPKKNGAWLVRNSWGEDFGNDGYFWISYEEPTLGATAVSMSFQPAETYDHNYHYDGTAGYSTNIFQDKKTGKWKGTLSTGGSAANMFCSGSASNEELRAVSVGFKTANLGYSLQIYASSSRMQNPEDGEPMLKTPVTGKTTASGFYQIELPEPVYLPKNTWFSVVVTITYTPNKNPDYAELFTDKNVQYTSSGAECLRMTNAVLNRESYVKSLPTSDWTDWTESAQPSFTFRIKALTADVEARKIDPKAVRVPDLTVELNKTAKLSYELTPANADSQTEIRWESSDESVASVDAEGNVRGVSRGTAVITCTVVYPKGTVTSAGSVTVIQFPEEMHFSTEDKNLKVNGKLTLVPSFLPKNSTVDSLHFTWYSDDTGAASVAKKGTNGLQATVTAKGEEGDTCEIKVTCVEKPELSAICYITLVKGGGSDSGGGTGGGGGGGGGGSTAGGPGKTGPASQAAFSSFWFQDGSGNWKVKNKQGAVVTSAWLCDDAVLENGKEVWYLLDASGNMVTGGLVRDLTGNYYSLEMRHNGHYGMLRYKNGSYDVGDGRMVYLEFEQTHGGSFGKITNTQAIETLKSIYGVTEFSIGNENCVYTGSFN